MFMTVGISVVPLEVSPLFCFFFITLKKFIAVPQTSVVGTSVVLLHHFFSFLISNLFLTSYLLGSSKETHFGVEK